MSKPQMNSGNQQMYQASDGKWYPTAQMPQGWDQNQNQNRGYYGQQPQMGYGQQQGGYYQGQQQPIYVQQQPGYGGGGGYGGGAGAGGAGCLAALCAGLLCFDLGACLF